MKHVPLPPDPEVELAVHRLVNAALDQPRPSKRLRKQLNTVLTLIAHPLRDRSADSLRVEGVA